MSSPAQQSRRPPQALDDILLANAKHRQNPADGEQADLTGQDLHGLDLLGYTLDGAILRNANLQETNLGGATLAGADVSGADFRGSSITLAQALSTKGWLLARWSPVVLDKLGLPTGHNERVEHKQFRGYALREAHLNDLDLSSAILAEAILDKADLTGANLEFADLEDASLRNADLTNAQGLNAYQLRGADLTLAKLPSDIADSLKAQPGVDEATKTSRKVLLTMLAACLYCWLTILSTDAGLLVGSSTLALPIVQTPIPILAFFGAAPVLLLIVYLYLHFSLQNLWDALATLPAFFPDGRPLHERALPWILSPIVRLYFRRLVPFCTRLARFQVRATSLLVWWGVPFTLVAFFLRFLVRHDRLITALHVVIAGVSVWLSAMFWRITKDTLRGIPQTRPRWLKALRSRELLAGVLAGAFLALFSVGCFHGEPPYQIYFGNDTPKAWSWRTAAPKLLGLVGWHAFGDLREIDLSRRPDDWDGRDLGRVKGARLQTVDLRAAEGFRLFAPNADLRSANLTGARFESADLRGADFREAHLEQADLSFADLRSAKFDLAHMEGTKLVGANVEGAWLSNAKGLEVGEIRSAANWFLAHLDDGLPSRLPAQLNVCVPDFCDLEDRLRRKDFSHLDFSELRFQLSFDHPDFSGANLQHCNLADIDLEGADLSKVDLRHANLNGTKLGGTNLAGADLRGVDLGTVYGLTRAQIESAVIDDETKLAPYLESQKPFAPKTK